MGNVNELLFRVKAIVTADVDRVLRQERVKAGMGQVRKANRRLLYDVAVCE